MNNDISPFLRSGEQGWYSTESTHVAQVWFWHGSIRGFLSLLLVFALLQGFFSGSPVFLPSQKATSLNSNSTRIEDPPENQLKLMWVPLKYYNLFFLYIFTSCVHSFEQTPVVSQLFCLGGIIMKSTTIAPTVITPASYFLNCLVW